jgi:hypothetical protein
MNLSGYFIQVGLLPEVDSQVFNCFLNALVIVHLFQFTNFHWKHLSKLQTCTCFYNPFLAQKKALRFHATLSHYLLYTPGTTRHQKRLFAVWLFPNR